MAVGRLQEDLPVVPVIQDPQHLVLGASWAPNLPVELCVLSERRLSLPEGLLVLRIIGESHWVTFAERSGSVFHELLACVPLPAAACSLYQRFSRLQSCSHRRGPYTVRVKIEPMSDALAQYGTEGDFLQVDFPDPYRRGEQPFTRVWWSVSDRLLRWWTSHIYLTERGSVAVLSESRYERSPLL